MKRLVMPILVFVVLAWIGLALASHPGQASADWMGWRIDTSASLIAVLCLAGSLLLAALWSGGVWLFRTPRRLKRARADRRQTQGLEALSQGYLALAAGDAVQALRLAREAVALDDRVLAHLLEAQAAEAQGDAAVAQGAYAALLETPAAQAAARAGLARVAAKRGGLVAAP